MSKGDESFELMGPEDEFDAIALNYTSGTTGDPKVRGRQGRGREGEGGEGWRDYSSCAAPVVTT